MSSFEEPLHPYETASRPHWITLEGQPLRQVSRPAFRRPFQFERMLAKLPPYVRNSLTKQQLDCISDALIPDPPQHTIDYRASIPLFGRRFYVALMAGRERRSLARLAQEGQSRARRVAGLYAVIMLLLVGAAFVACVLLGYVVKSALGVDLIEGPSILHQYVFGPW
ncbi:MAG: hypothetical protein KDJ17_13050 [Hyphomicrobiaceae bacterium]|nr:hypothetical protein [Hyphomicrobiaceae bacterium]